jgi:zinc protease
VLTEQLKVTLANRGVLPETAFTQTLDAALSQNHLRTQPMTVARVDQMNLDKSLAFYKGRFADASGFTFVFVGSFDLPTMKPLVERYLGSLPALHRNETARDVGIRPPAGIVKTVVRKGIEPKSQVSIVFTGPFQNDEMHRVTLTTMAETLSGNLFDTLRQALGGTYGVSVEPQFFKRPIESFRVTINFTCDPARTDSLVATLFQLIEQFKTVGPVDGQIVNARTAFMRDLETNLQQNEYLLNRILFKYQFGEDLNEIFNMRQFYDQLTAPMIRDAARTYLNTNRYVEVTLLPETEVARQR